MNWNIKDNGESIEKLATEKLPPSVISKYNEFWGKYIGQKEGIALPIGEINDQINRERLLLGQWNYTLLQNLLFLNLINNIPYKIKPKQFEKVAKSLRIFYEVTHILYNSIEIVKKYNEKFADKNIDIAKFKAFVEYRNILAHNIRPFIKFTTQVEVPKNFNVFENLDKDLIWALDAVPNVEYYTLENYKQYAMDSIKQMLFDLINNSVDIMMQKIKTNVIKDAKPQDGLIYLSGSTSIN